MRDIVLLTGNGCPACKTLKQRLDTAGLLDKVTVRNVHEDDEAFDLLQSIGIRSIPLMIDKTNPKDLHTLVGSNHPIELYESVILK